MSRWELLFEPGIFEIASLPGTGKTTIARALLQRSGKPSWVGAARRVLRKSPLVWPFHVTTFIRYRRLYAGLLAPAPASSRGSRSHILASMRARRSPAYRSIRKKLSTLHMEHWLLRIETVVRRRIAVLDEGYVQRGLAMCMRTPSDRHEALWNAYLDAIPAGVKCLMLDGSIDQAIGRALARERGAPAILAAKDLATHYAYLADILKSGALMQKMQVARISASGDAETTAARTLEALARETDTTRMVLFIRDSAQH